MKLKITFVLIFVFIFQFYLQSSNTSEYENNNKVQAITQNENILAHVFIYTGWISIPEIMSCTHDNLRNTLISILVDSCNASSSDAMALDDNNLAWSSLMYFFLKDKVHLSSSQLFSMSIDDCRNTIITLNNQNTSYSINQLQSYSNAQNLNIANGWWFVKNDDSKSKATILNNVKDSNPRFDMKDNRGKNLDVLKIVLANEVDYKYLSLYHYQISSNYFVLALAGSNNLTNWTFITTLGDRAHQGDIKKWGNGYLVANEQDIASGSNNIRLRYYNSYQSLIANNATNDISLARKLSNYAEGTPDIRAVIGDQPSTSHIVLGFHYYDNGIKDQLATGILHNFSNWRPWENDISNYNITLMGYKGNIGGRSGFQHNDKYVLQEAQLTSNDWSSWRMLLGDGAFYTTLSPATPKGSVSFANPAIADLGYGNFAVSSFMPTEGNQVGERGELLYKVDFSNSTTSIPTVDDNEFSSNSIKIISDQNYLYVINAEGYDIKAFNLLGNLIKSINKASNPQLIAVPTSVILRLSKDDQAQTLKHIRIK